MRPALRLRSFDRDATLIAPDEGELDLAVGYLPRVRRWHERQVLYEEATSRSIFPFHLIGGPGNDGNLDYLL